jgi:hypothetical protein
MDIGSSMAEEAFLRDSLLKCGYFSEIVRNFYVVPHIEGLIGLLFASRIDVTTP